MKFEEIMEHLRNGNEIKNNNWNGLKTGKEMYLHLQQPDKNSMNTEPYIVFHSDKKTFPWTPSCLDLMSEEWELRNPDLEEIKC